MKQNLLFTAIVISLTMLMPGCAAKQHLVINHGSVQPGTEVSRAGTPLPLVGTPIKVGEHLPSVDLVDANTLADVDISTWRGKILLLSIVPSIDTKVCEAQTHYLGEQGNRLPTDIERITISRDTPFAQRRFAKEAKLNNIRFLSDYKQGDFGRALGLLMKGPMLLARSIIIVDKQGVVRYIQVVPDITNLPDMERAFDQAEKLLKKDN